MINIIKLYTKNILCEGLNKNEYNKILKDIKIGMEIEVINDEYGGSVDPYEEYGSWYFEDEVKDFNNKVEDFNNHLYQFKEELPEEVVSVLENDGDTDSGFNEVSELDSYETDYLRKIYEYYDHKIYEKVTESQTTLMYINNFKNVLERQDSQFWLSQITDELKEDVKQLSFYSDKTNEYKEWVYQTIDGYMSDLKDYMYALKNLGESTLGDIESKIELIAEDIEMNSDSSSFYELKELAEQEISSELTEMEQESGAIGDWDIVEDASLGEVGIEVITPAVDYKTFIHYIPTIAGKLGKVGFYGDNRCGYHIGLSSDKINIHELINDAYIKYQKMGFNKLTSLMVATQQGYKSVYRHNDSSRNEHEHYAKALIQHVAPRRIGTDEGYSLEDLLYSNKYDLKAQDFFDNPPKFANTNLSKNNYIELRTLGGSNGWDIVNDENKLKVFLYDAISQVFGAIKPLDRKDIVKLMRQQIRKLEKDKPTPTVDSREKSLKLVAMNILKLLGDKISKVKKGVYKDTRLEYLYIKGNDYEMIFDTYIDKIIVGIKEIGTDLFIKLSIKDIYVKINSKEMTKEILDYMKKVNPEKFGEL